MVASRKYAKRLAEIAGSVPWAVKNWILFRDFSGQIILGCSRKLGSMVRITGLQTPRNTPFISR